LFRNTNQQDQQRKLVGYIIPTVIRSPSPEVPPVKLATPLHEGSECAQQGPPRRSELCAPAGIPVTME
jgi:hypothetical protein